MCEVLNRAWQKPTENTVYIGRPSKWGNPFSHMENTLAEFKVKDRDEAVDKYEEYLLEKMKSPTFVKMMKSELKGKDLMCWCKPARCHGDVLLKYANEENNEEV